MTTNEAPDTITVELPIRPMLNGDVKASSMRLTRRGWREAANGGGVWGDIVRAAAPAVVAWIERDEWESLDVPAVGRQIRATLRDGRVVEGEVRQVEDMGVYVDVLMSEDAFSIDTSPKAHPDPADITAWEYVDEPAVDLAAIADKVAAAVNELREAIG